LTPRYPDRDSLVQDNLYEEFAVEINRIAMQMLKEYFANLENESRFQSHIHHSLLLSYFEFANHEEAQAMSYIPVESNTFGNREYFDTGIMSKQNIIEHGYSFCCGIDDIDDQFLLGADEDEIKCIQVNSKVAVHLIDLGIPQLVKIETATKPEHQVNLEPLVLKLIYADGKKESLSLPEAVLVDCCHNTYVYAKDSSDILGIFTDYFEYAFINDECRSFDDIYDEIRESLIQELTTRFSILKREQFAFLPAYSNIKNICFDNGNLAVTYNDGQNRIFEIRE